MTGAQYLITGAKCEHFWCPVYNTYFVYHYFWGRVMCQLDIFLLFFKGTHSNYRNDNIILSLGPIKVHLIIVAEVLRSKQIIKNPQNLNIENIYSSFKELQIKKVLNVILKACEKQMDKSQFSNSPLLTL